MPNDAAALAECIARLVEDDQLRTNMGELGRQRMTTELNWEAQVPALLAAYDRALAVTSGAALDNDLDQHARAS